MKGNHRCWNWKLQPHDFSIKWNSNSNFIFLVFLLLIGLTTACWKSPIPLTIMIYMVILKFIQPLSPFIKVPAIPGSRWHTANDKSSTYRYKQYSNLPTMHNNVIIVTEWPLRTGIYHTIWLMVFKSALATHAKLLEIIKTYHMTILCKVPGHNAPEY